MLKQSSVDAVFRALADGTRRELVQQLSRGPATVTDLARPLAMSLAAVVQHLQILEDSGVVISRKVGRVRTCQLDPRGLLQAERWIARRRALWEGRLDRLGALLEAQESPGAGKRPGRTTDRTPRGRGGHRISPEGADT